MKSVKVLVLYNHLFHYRVPIWNVLSESYDLTVAYSHPAKQEVIDSCKFKTLYLPTKQISKITYHKDNILKLANNYDVVLSYGQVAYIKYSLLGFCKRKFKLIYWFIGAPASYNRHYGDGSKLYFKIYDFFHKRADALVFYSEPAVEAHVNRGFDRKKLFVANNTVEVIKTELCADKKNTILFIGTLYLEKGLQILLDAYKKAYCKNTNINSLTIVGGGAQFERIKQWIKDNRLEQKIIMTGPIYDSKTKSEIFSKSIACISPLQAGLSVLESMGYGVPFITSEDAITGGESFNIEDGVSGLRLKSVENLDEVILDICNDRQKYLDMGQKAYSHYWTNRRPENMAGGLAEAIEYVLSQK